MENFIKSLHKAIKNCNWYAALFIAISLPDICGKIEYPRKESSVRYADWFDKYLKSYKGFLSGKDCYALRCALLHEGSADITNQKIREVLEYFVFLPKGPHCNLIKNCVIYGKNQSFLQLRVDTFTSDLANGVESWLQDIKDNEIIIKRCDETIKIYESGFTVGGIHFC